MPITKPMEPFDPDEIMETEEDSPEIEVEIANPDAVSVSTEDGGIIIDFTGEVTEDLLGPDHESNLAEFLDKHPGNAANGGHTFKLIDKNASAEEMLEQEFSQHEAVSLVRDKSIDELLPVAMYLDININQKNAEIKRELLAEAKSNPTRFIQLFDNPQVRCRSAVMQAVDFQILNAKADGMYWYDSNRLIVSAPVGTDPIEVTTRFFMTDKGMTAYDRVLEELDKI